MEDEWAMKRKLREFGLCRDRHKKLTHEANYLTYASVFFFFFKGWELLIHYKLTKYINRTRLGSSGKNEALKVKIDGPLREYRVLISLNEFLLLELD